MKRYKIGLITYCVGNQGSILQCYATQKYLEKNGLDCCLFIRHESGLARIKQSLEYRINAYLKLVKFPQYRHVYKNCVQQTESSTLTPKSVNFMKDFINRYICEERCSWNQLKAIAESDEYLAFFSGSDQIWSGQWFLTNRIWFLRFCPQHKRVAWMPSFGTDLIAEYNDEIYKKYISEYQFLSIREKSGQRLIKELIEREVPVLPDPVYLLSADEWRAVAADVTYKTNYVLMFFISKPSALALELAELRADQNNAEIIWLSYNHGFDGTFIDGGPSEFISYIDKASLVLTDSFHASLFSIILSTPFYVYQRTDGSGSKQIGRIQNLLMKFGMQNRLIQKKVHEPKTDYDRHHIQDVLNEEKTKIDKYMKLIKDYYLGGTK